MGAGAQRHELAVVAVDEHLREADAAAGVHVGFTFLDDQPLTDVLPDDSGNWSVESDAKLGDGRHTVRADQYDTTTAVPGVDATADVSASPASDDAALSTSPSVAVAK